MIWTVLRNVFKQVGHFFHAARSQCIKLSPVGKWAEADKHFATGCSVGRFGLETYATYSNKERGNSGIHWTWITL